VLDPDLAAVKSLIDKREDFAAELSDGDFHAVSVP
jgi:hypothetical protein